MIDPDDHGFAFTWGDPELAALHESVAKAKTATLMLSEALRASERVIRDATNEMRRMKVECSCGRKVTVIKLDEHAEWHAKRSTP